MTQADAAALALVAAPDPGGLSGDVDVGLRRLTDGPDSYRAGGTRAKRFAVRSVTFTRLLCNKINN